MYVYLPLYQSNIMHAYKLLEFYYPVVCNLFGQNKKSDTGCNKSWLFSLTFLRKLSYLIMCNVCLTLVMVK